ncbi:MAG: hypothetical protein NT062_12715 [Proteobacteria bacterium]|nr:hypothetical protein [Pseudomonadota bacterium]
MLPAWTFVTPPATSRHATVMLVAFSAGPLDDDVPFSLSRFGVPAAELVELFDVRTIERGHDPRWFDAFRSGSLRTIAERDLGAGGLAALDLADRAHVVHAEIGSPGDLGYLQTAWAYARYLAVRGASCVLDMMAIRWTAGGALPPADAALDVGREVQIIYETDSTRADHAHALHTRGMRKFGAPDLIALCADADADLVSQVIAQVAASVARGSEITAPRHGIEVAAGMTWFLVDDEHGLAGLLNLNNEARVLVDGDGHDLVGLLRN